VTHGALVRATVAPRPPGAGVGFRAGEGIGTVTRPGLALPVGEPAINPGPRRMIREAIEDMAEALDAAADVDARPWWPEPCYVPQWSSCFCGSTCLWRGAQ